jgi:hypothetical protein
MKKILDKSIFLYLSQVRAEASKCGTGSQINRQHIQYDTHS